LVTCAILGAGQYVFQNPPPSLLPESLRGWDRVFHDTGLFIRNSVSPGELVFVNSDVRGELVYYAGCNPRISTDPDYVMKTMIKARAEDASIFFFDGLQPPEHGWVARLARPVHYLGMHIECVARIRLKTENVEFVFRSEGTEGVEPGRIVNGKLAIGAEGSLLKWIKSGTIVRFPTGDAVVTGSEVMGGCSI
jgi:hypothetical protein